MALLNCLEYEAIIQIMIMLSIPSTTFDSVQGENTDEDDQQGPDTDHEAHADVDSRERCYLYTEQVVNRGAATV